jgi:hypothetical protein
VLIRKKKVPMLLLKLDISKAFDTLSWPFLGDLASTWIWGAMATMDRNTTQYGLVKDHSEWTAWANH